MCKVINIHIIEIIYIKSALFKDSKYLKTT